MIDLHCHILPGLDDGARSFEEAVLMARLAAADGIRQIVATPHTENGRWLNRAHDVQAAVEYLQFQLDKVGVPVQLQAGSEVHLHVEMLNNLEAGELATLGGGRYLLVELPATSVPAFAEEMLCALLMRGVTPILAHPERNTVLRDDLSRLSEWVRQGVVTQVTAGSLLGQMGQRSQAAALAMVKQGLVYLIASDAHDARRRSTRRPLLRQAYQTLAEVASAEVVETFQANARAVLKGEDCTKVRPLMSERGWFRR